MATPSPESDAGERPLARHLLWAARPVFLSSTFRDMHAERDYLRSHAFPELEDKLRERAHYLEMIDLRQGVETAEIGAEEERELKVLKVCLDEIVRSRPFFLGLLGDRYGWVPPAERMADAARCAGFDRDVAGHSVTELEILYGVFDNADQRRRSWFYLREMDYTGISPEQRKQFDDRAIADDPGTPPAQRQAAADRVSKLDALKERLRNQLPDRVRTYRVRWDDPEAGLQELNRIVLTDLWSDLAQETAESLRAAPTTWQEADQRVLDDFVAQRLRGFVERPAVTQRMLDHVLTLGNRTDPSWGLVVTGESGSGKSCVFSRLYRELHGRPGVLLLAHAAGISVSAGWVDRMLRRWIGQLAAFLGVENPIPDDEQAPGSAASEPLSPETGREKPLCERIDQAFGLLLARAAGRTRVVVLVDALNEFEPTVRARHLTWLPKRWPEGARLLATGIAGPAAAVLAQRGGARESAPTLFPRTRRVLSALAQRRRAGESALPSIRDMMALQSDWAQRSGAGEYVLPPVGRDEAAEMARRYFRERHHREVNRRALDVLLDKRLPGEDRAAHANPLWLALALQEMNLLEADDFERAERQFGHLPGAERVEALQVQQAEQLPADVPGVYSQLLERAERDFGRGWTQSLMNLIALGRAGWRESDLRELAPAVSGVVWQDLGFAGVRRALGPHLVQRGAEAQWDFFHAQLREAVLTRNLPQPARRHALHGQIADHLEHLSPSDSLRVAELMVHEIGTQDRLRAARYYAGLTDGDELSAATRAVDEYILAALPEEADARLNWILSLLDEPQLEADECAELCNHYCSELLDVTKGKGTLATRLVVLKRTNEVLQQLCEHSPDNVQWQGYLSTSHAGIGVSLFLQGEPRAALAAYRASVAISERLAAIAPGNAERQRSLWVVHNLIGEVALAQGIRGDLGAALAAFRASLEISERLAAADPGNPKWERLLSMSQMAIGGVLLRQRDLRAALATFRRGQVFFERLAAANPSNANWHSALARVYFYVGIALREQGQFSAALDAYTKYRDIMERLAAADPDNAEWQYDLAGAHINMGNLLRDQGNLMAALSTYRAGLEICKRLVAVDETNAVWEHSLFLARLQIRRVWDASRVVGGCIVLFCLTATVWLIVRALTNSWLWIVAGPVGFLLMLRALNVLVLHVRLYRQRRRHRSFLREECARTR